MEDYFATERNGQITMHPSDFKYFSREEFFDQLRDGGFEVNPLDMSLAKAQFEMQKRIRKNLVEKQECIEAFELNSPRTMLSKVSIRCSMVTGEENLYDLVMRVEDKELKHVAMAWLAMGDTSEMELELASNQFVPKCKRWLKWFDYAKRNYPTEKGKLYYWTEWQKMPPEGNWYDGDVDLYGISNSQAYELMTNLKWDAESNLDNDSLFRNNRVLDVRYPGAPGNESKFECMSLQLRCYERRQIDLVGYIWSLQRDFTSKATRIIVHSFDSIRNCVRWLDRGKHTAHDCCLRMEELLMFGYSY